MGNEIGLNLSRKTITDLQLLQREVTEAVTVVQRLRNEFASIGRASDLSNALNKNVTASNNLTKSTRQLTDAEIAQRVATEAARTATIQSASAQRNANLETLGAQRVQTEAARTAAAQTRAEAAKARELQRAATQTERTARQTELLNSAYNQAVRQLTAYDRELRDLSVSSQQGSARFRELTTEAARLRTSIREADRVTENFRANVGNYPTVVNAARSSFVSVLSVLWDL